MLNLSKLSILRQIQAQVLRLNKSWFDTATVRNFSIKKTYYFEPHMRLVLNALRQLLTCTESKALNIYDQFPSIRSIDTMSTVGNNIDILMKRGVTTETIIENPFLLIMTEDVLQTRLSILHKLNLSDKTINNFVPLLEMKEYQLRKVCDSIMTESKLVPGGNRIYYLSNKLKIEPNIVAKYCTKNDYSLLAPFESVDKKLQILLDYNVKPFAILKSLYVLEYSETIYISRLERLLSLNTNDVKLWLIKCADDVFEKYLSRIERKIPQPDMDIIEAVNEEKIRTEQELNEMLDCESAEAAHIYYNQISHFNQLDCAKLNIEFLTSHGFSLETITANSAVLVVPLEQLQENIRILEAMDSKYIDDVLPLICVEKNELEKFKSILDVQELDSEHPIYYFSEKLKVPPSVISSHFAKSPNIFFKTPKILQKKLDLLLAYGVQLDSILNSPLTFRIGLDALKNRLEKLKSESVEPILSYMLTCKPFQLKPIIEKQHEHKKLLDGCNDPVDYIANRLKWNDATRKRVLKSRPAIAKCNMPKIRKLLDFLLNETHFTEFDISSCPRIFTLNFKELKLRISELTTINFIPKRLYIICLDRKQYLKIIKNHCQILDDEIVWNNFQKIEKRIKER